MMSNVQFLFTLAVLVASYVYANAQKEACAKGESFAYDLEDCNKFYTCVGPLAYHMTCTSGLIFSLERKGCVFEDEDMAKDCLMKSAKWAEMKAKKEAKLGANMTNMEDIEWDKKKEMDNNVDEEGNGENKWADKKLISKDKKGLKDKIKVRIEETKSKDDEADAEKDKKMDKKAMPDKGDEDMKNKDEPIPVNNLFSAGLMSDDMGFQAIDDATTSPPPLDPHCNTPQDIVPHESLCHRYYNCTQPHMRDMNRYLSPYEYECPYPQLFSVETLSCQDFEAVTCGDRMEYRDPCDYTENKCSGPNCRPCSVVHPSCINQPDGLNYWPGREGSGFWVKCRGQRTISHGNCAKDDPSMRNIFSKKLMKCVPYNDVISEVCQWSERYLPHPSQCHQFYDCNTGKADGTEIEEADSAEISPPLSSSSPSSTTSEYLKMCPYPLLYSVRAGKCLNPKSVRCGTRREAKTPCTMPELLSHSPHAFAMIVKTYDLVNTGHADIDVSSHWDWNGDSILLLEGITLNARTAGDYMPTECVDPSYASCEGLPDGKNVFRTREGTPHYVVCENERTVEKGMCEMDDRGMYQQFSPGVGKCMSV